MNITRLDEVSACTSEMLCLAAIQQAPVNAEVIKGYLGIDSEDN